MGKNNDETTNTGTSNMTIAKSVTTASAEHKQQQPGRNGNGYQKQWRPTGTLTKTEMLAMDWAHSLLRKHNLKPDDFKIYLIQWAAILLLLFIMSHFLFFTCIIISRRRQSYLWVVQYTHMSKFMQHYQLYSSYIHTNRRTKYRTITITLAHVQLQCYNTCA